MRKPHRLLSLILLTAALFIGVIVMSPQQIPVIFVKLLHVSLGGIVAFWLDVLFFPYARPDGYLVDPNYHDAPSKMGDADCPVVMGYRITFAAAMLRRAIIVGSAMLAIALGM